MWISFDEKFLKRYETLVLSLVYLCFKMCTKLSNYLILHNSTAGQEYPFVTELLGKNLALQ